MVSILHTSDLHLGRPFRGLPTEVAQRLRQHRLEAIDRLGVLAQEHNVDAVLIAGDLYDSHHVPEQEVHWSVERLLRIGAPVIVLPGNHDPAEDPASIYRRGPWLKQIERSTAQGWAPNQLFVLDQVQPWAIPQAGLVLLPAPTLRKHPLGDPTAHLTREFGADVGQCLIRVGLAHGGVVDFTPEQNADVIDPQCAQRAGLDYLALGDWHGRKEIDPRTHYCGTPEPLTFDDQGRCGGALLVRIDRPGATPEVQPVGEAQTHWLDWSSSLHHQADVEALLAAFEHLQHSDRLLLRLKLEGRLNLAQRQQIDSACQSLRERLLHCNVDDAGLGLQPTEEELASFTAEGFVGQAMAELRQSISSQGPTAQRDLHALKLLHELMNPIGSR